MRTVMQNEASTVPALAVNIISWQIYFR